MQVYSYLILFFFKFIFGAPISTKKSDDIDLEALLGGLDYSAYLQQVIKELQGDSDFNKNIADVKKPDDVGNLLQYASGRVRTKLDELKRIEIARLNKLEKEWKYKNEIETHPLEMQLPPTKPVDMSHLDDMDPNSFNPKDLKQLMDKASEIINKIDAKDEESFKYHEMEKNAARRAEMENISDVKLRNEREKKFSEDKIQRKKKRKVIYKPGSIAHLKSVWKEDDHMDEDSFNPKSFFLMHDINDDGNWDIAELETLMQRELDKAYDPKSKYTDMVERDHEMIKMRNYFLSKVDTNKNHLISFNEFNKWMQGDAVKLKMNWKIGEELEPNYSQDEFDRYYKDYVAHHPTIQPTTTKSH